MLVQGLAGLLEILEHLMKEDVPQVISRQARGGPSRATADPLPSLLLASRRPLYPDPRYPRDRRAKQSAREILNAARSPRSSRAPPGRQALRRQPRAPQAARDVRARRGRGGRAAAAAGHLVRGERRNAPPAALRALPRGRGVQDRRGLPRRPQRRDLGAPVHRAREGGAVRQDRRDVRAPRSVARPASLLSRAFRRRVARRFLAHARARSCRRAPGTSRTTRRSTRRPS